VRAARYARDEAYRLYQDLMAKRDRGVEHIGDSVVARAHDAYLDAEGQYNRAVENAEFQLLSARNAVNQAYRAVEQTARDLEAVLEEPDALDLQAARLDIEEAESALADARLEAPFDGTVTTLNIDVGDTIGTGQSALVLATLDQLQAVTKDLTELDVVRVEVGQEVVVTVDALPDEIFVGTVSEIALAPGDYRGDVVYAVTVDLADSHSPLYWGMTALVEIETE